MRILVTHPRLSVMGGGERVAIHSIKEAVREGHEVSLACEEFDIPAFEQFFAVEGLFNDVRMLTYRPFHAFTHQAVLYQRLAYNQLRLRRILGHEKPFDLILNTAEIGNQPPGKARSVMYCYFPEYFSHLESNSVRGFWELYYQPAKVFYHERVNRVDQLLAVSNFTRGFVKQRWGRDSITLYPPCPIELYSGMDLPREDLVVTVGRIAPEKRMTVFAELARMLPNVKFAIIGSVSQDQKSYFEALKSSAPNNLSIIVSPLRMVKEVLGRAKIYVHCAENEHFGITIVEAMAAGCVPVVHKSGGPPEIVSADSGYTWYSLQEASKLVSNLVENDNLRQRLSKGAVFRAEQFRSEEFEAGIKKVLEKFS